MSLYVRWTNLIKEKSDKGWLTDSQREIYNELIEKWRTHLFINLYGPPGRGKTFIARLLAKEKGYLYTQDLHQVPENTKQVVLDNVEYSRFMRAVVRARNIDQVIIISNRPIKEAMPRTKLELDQKDIRQFQACLSDYCGITFTETIPKGRNLAEIIHREVIERGEKHVN